MSIRRNVMVIGLSVNDQDIPTHPREGMHSIMTTAPVLMPYTEKRGYRVKWWRARVCFMHDVEPNAQCRADRGLHELLHIRYMLARLNFLDYLLLVRFGSSGLE
jgi:hypothetical protein